MNDLTGKKLDFKLIYFLMTVFTTFSVSISILGTYEFDYPFALVFLLSLLFCSFAFVIFNNMKSGIILISIITIGIIIFAFCTYYIEYLAMYMPIGDSFIWFFQFLFNNELIPKDTDAYVQIISSFIIAFAAILFYFVLYKKELFYVTLVISISAYAFQTNAYNNRTELPWVEDFEFKFSFFSFIFLCLLFYFLNEYKKRKSMKNDGFTSPAKYLRLTIIITIIIFLFVYKMPKSENPIQIPDWFVEKVYKMQDDVSFFMRRNILKDNTRFDLSSTGFSPNRKKLGGPIIMNENVALFVNTDKSVYLKGTVKDDYTGSIWRNIEKKEYKFEDNFNSLKLDLIEKDFSKTLIDNKKSTTDSMWVTNKMNIQYQRLVTKSVFHPLKTYQINFIVPDEFDTKVSVDSTLLSNKACPKIFQYEVSAYDINYNYPETLNVLRKSYKGLYNNLEKTPEGLTISEFNSIKENAEKIYIKYAQIPRSMPARVMELAQKVTENKNNDFDKVKAIEYFLAYNYEYNIIPPKVPSNRDFVDYFLFDGKEGYCTYYASAMTMMIRSIGLPARYVEGFRVKATKEYEEYTKVINNEGHSWVEVYFEGIGWVSFEPTTAFYEIYYSEIDDAFRDQFRDDFSDIMTNDYSSVKLPISDLKNIKDVNPELIPDDNPNPEDTPNPSLIVVTQSPPTSVPTATSGNGPGTDTNPRVSGPPSSNTDNEDATKNGKGIFILFVLSIIAGVGSWIFYNYKRLNRLITKVSSMNNNDAVIAMFKYYFDVFKQLGYEARNDETPLEFMSRLMNDNTYNKMPIEKLFDIFIKARYGKYDVIDQDKSFAIAFNKELIIEAKNNIGTLRFHINRLILGKI